jgi:hypothetical protein
MCMEMRSIRQLLVGAAVLLLATGAAHAEDQSKTPKSGACLNPAISENSPDCWDQSDCIDRPKDDPDCREYNRPRSRVTVTPNYDPPVYGPPIGWVYGPYTQCGDPPRCSMGVVNVPADGLNVRIAPDGPPVMSLVNGTPLYPMDKRGDWLLVAPACDLTPTWAWSWNAGVPLNRCWVYF